MVGQKPGVLAIFFEASLQVDGTAPGLHCSEGSDTGFGQPPVAPDGAKKEPEGHMMALSVVKKYMP